jgi:hypothetical protein
MTGEAAVLDPGFERGTGQVGSEAPNPPSTWRRPVLPRRVTSTPLSGNILIQPAPSLWSSRVDADDLLMAQATGEAEQQHGAVAWSASIERFQFQYGDQNLGNTPSAGVEQCDRCECRP